MESMTTDALKVMLSDADARIREMDLAMRSTPADTTAYAAMRESRPGLIGFRHRIDDELARRGA